MMVGPCFIAFMIGLLLGLRFKVFVLVPVQVLLLGLVAGLVGWGGVAPGAGAILAFGLSACLQLGYVVMLIATSLSGRAVRIATASKA